MLSLNLPGTHDRHWCAPVETDSLPAFVESAGWTLETDGYLWDGEKRGTHRMVVLQYSLAGKGWVSRQGQRWTPEPGDLMIVPVPDAHVYALPPSGGSWEFVYICLGGESAVKWAHRLVNQWGPVHRFEPADPLITEFMNLYRRIASRELRDPFESSRFTWGLVSGLYQTLQQRAAGQVPSGFEHLPDWVDENLHRMIGVDEMAEVTGFSRYYFSRLLKEKYGISPGRYLEQQRIRKAATFLQDTAVPISEVGARSGFPDPNYFARVFRKVTGDSPRDFRHRLHRTTYTGSG